MQALEKKTKNAIVASAILCLCAGSNLALAQVEFEPYVELNLNYTDNIALQPDPIAEDDFATEVNPGFSLTKPDGRLTGDIDYRMQNIFYSRNSDLDETYHQLFLNSVAEVLPQLFFIDTNFRYTQAIVNPAQAIPLSNVSSSSNLTDFWSLYVAPYFEKQLGSRHMVRLSYQAGILDYREIAPGQLNNIDDFESDLVEFYLGSQPREGGFQWNLNYQFRKNDYKTFSPFEYEVAYLDLQIPLGSNLAFVVAGGLETDVLFDQTSGGLDSEYWSAGLLWDLGRNNSIEARFGERYFGSTVMLALTLQTRQLGLEVSYQEDPTTISFETLTLTQDLPGGARDGAGRDIRPLSSDVYLNKAFRAVLTWTGRRSEVSLAVTDTKREYQAVNEDEAEQQIVANWRMELGPRTTLFVEAYAAEIEFRRTDNVDDLYQFVVGAERQLGRRTDVWLRLRYERRDSEALSGTFDYEERAVVMGVTRRF